MLNHLAFCCKPEIFLTPLKQKRRELLRQRDEGLADGGLGNAVELGRFGEALGLSQVAENLEALDLHESSE